GGGGRAGRGRGPPSAGQVGRVAGGAGAIGFAIARKLIEAGAHVVLAALARDRLDAAVAELDPRASGVAAGVPLDVTDERSVADGFATVCRLYGGLDVLVLNAGIAHVAPIDQTDPATFRRV